MTINESMSKSQLVEKAKELARKSKALGIIAGLLLIVLAGVIAVKGTPEQAQATFSIGGEILTAVFDDGEVAVVSATAPVSVTTLSGTEVISGTDINSFVDQK